MSLIRNNRLFCVAHEEEGKKERGQPHKRLIDSIANWTGLNFVEAQRLAQDRYYWKELVLPVPTDLFFLFPNPSVYVSNCCVVLSIAESCWSITLKRSFPRLHIPVVRTDPIVLPRQMLRNTTAPCRL